ALMVPLAMAFNWRVAFLGAALFVLLVLAAVLFYRQRLALEPMTPAVSVKNAGAPGTGSLDFLRLPAVWVCFGFFFALAIALGGVQTFAPEAARMLHGVPVALAAMCISVYMICSA